MAWYYYSGKIVKAVRVSSTKSVAVRPNTKVEILEVTREVQALLRAGVLRKTGRPRDAQSVGEAAPEPTPRMQDVVERSPLASYFAEKGVTSSKAMPPQKPVGAPEFTVHEMEMAGKTVTAPTAGAAADALPVADVAGVAEEGERKWSKRRRDQR